MVTITAINEMLVAGMDNVTGILDAAELVHTTQTMEDERTLHRDLMKTRLDLGE